MSKKFRLGGDEESHAFGMVVAIVLVILGALLLNVRFEFVNIAVDVSSETFQTILGAVAVIGGGLMFYYIREME